MMYEEVSESETEGESASETESVTHSEQLVDNSEKVTDQTQELLNESEEEPAKESREEIHERQAEEIPEQIRNEQRNEYLPQCPEFDYDKDVKRIRKEERENMAKEQEMRKKQGGTNSTLLPFSSDEMGLLRCGPPGGWTVSNPPLQPSKPLKQPFAEYNANYAPYSKPNKSRLKATNPKSDDNSSSGPSLHHRTPVLKPKITHNLLHELGKVLHEKLIALGRISSMALDGCVEPDDGNSPNFEEEDEVATKLLREKSPYYHLFRKIRKNLVQDVEVDAASNPYYSPSVLNIYENTYVPFIGIFARGVVQKTKYPNFVRVTNGGTESEFRLIKNNLIANPENVADFIRNRFTITNGKNKRFVLENLPKSKTRKEPPTSSANLQNDVTCYAEERNAEFSQQEVEECAETWNKRGKRGRTNKYMHNRRDIRLKDLQRGKSDAEGRTLQPTQTISPIAGSEVTQFPDTTVFFRTESFPPIPKKEFHHFFHSDRKLSDTIINGRLHKLMDDAEGEQKKIFVSHSGTMYHHPELFFGGRSVEAAGWQSTMATLEDLSSVHTHIMHPLRHGDHWLLTTVEIKTRTLQLYDPLDHDNNYLKNITDNLTHFFDEVFTQKRVGEPQTKKHWTVEFPGCPKQRDSSSCGIYIIKYALQYYQAFPHIKHIEINQNETEDQLRMDIAQEMINSEEGKPFLAKFGEDAELFIKNLKLQDPNIIKSLQSNPQLLNLSGDEITTSNLERKFRKIVEDVLTDQHGNLEKQKTRVKTLGKDHVAKEKDKYKRYKLIEALSEESIMKAYHEIKLDVLQIYVPKPETFSGEYKCPRQKIWVERKPNFCANLQQMVVSYPFSAKSFQIISTQLSSDLRKAENLETLAFNDILQVSNVLVPEAFERIYSKIMQMPLEHAQRELENNFPT
ncbi:Sentrin-specific protease 1 [Folsomia candida]|uniref:Sentrin-specific protease 1 n=1 Tax=Folsomia candida TaxID=158441 RepID=A0A226DNB3_FOLCA|nr:Sentrin-specific protease 1 [Folsomia candida]